MQARRVKESSFCGRKIAQVHVGDPQELLYLILVGMDLQLLFEFFPRLGITLFLIVFEIGVSEKAMRPRVPWIELDGLAKLRDRLLWNLGDQVGPSKQHVKC